MGKSVLIRTHPQLSRAIAMKTTLPEAIVREEVSRGASNVQRGHASPF